MISVSHQKIDKDVPGEWWRKGEEKSELAAVTLTFSLVSESASTAPATFPLHHLLT